MRLVFSPEAQLEFEEAEQYYRLQFPGLDHHLREEIRSALRRLRSWPLAFPVEQGDIHRVLLRRFPYKLLYSIEADHLYVIAVAHQHRKPNYWFGRTKSP